MPLLANPHSRIVTPFFLLHLALGPVVGLELEIPLHLAIAWSGGYVLGRILGMSRLAAAVCATVFPGSSWLYLHVAMGHVVYLPSLYLPWMVALLCLAMTRRRFWLAALAGLPVALTLGEGGVYAVPQALLLVGFVALARSAGERSVRPIASVLVLTAFAVGFAAVKLLPTLALLRAHPRLMYPSESNSTDLLLTALFSRNQDAYRSCPGFWLFHEYGAYVGVLPAGLAVLGILSAPRRALPWVLSGAAFLVLAIGDFGTFSPWSLVHRLPVFSSERVPSRFLIPFTFTVGVLAALGIDALRSRLRTVGTVLAACLIAMLVFDFWLVSPANLRHAFEGSEAELPVSPQFRQLAGKRGGGQMLAYAKANTGYLLCGEYAEFRTTAIGADQPGYRGEQSLLGAGTLRLAEWTPNVLEYEVDVPQPTVLVVNQNFDEGWRVGEGAGEVFSHDGLLAVRVPAGGRRLRLSYHGHLFDVGVGITALTGLALWLLWRRESS